MQGNITIETDVVRVELALQKIAERLRLASYAIAVGMLANYSTAPVCPGETLACDGAHLRRHLAFHGGRACARAACAKLGVPSTPIPVGDAGEPIWPGGVTGSISHTNEIVAAVVAHDPPVGGVGLDLEADEPLNSEAVMEVVCRPEELVPGHRIGTPINLRRGKLLFVVKEAIYKLYWPLTGAFADFHDFSVTLDETRGLFQAELVNARLPLVAGRRTVAGGFAQSPGIFIALTAMGACKAEP
ncbi:MAG TPA: 4'-phosphopantetheinyl transferase superfamily protein [Stellaceae bacterium]|nr:4'-phosphopantetheinyl transferase superfamily protein [Stellaceae bacterium]